MKIMIASDIHGDAVCTEKLLEIYKNEGCSQLVLLGDILYHGPRNDLPAGYAPKRVIPMLNAMTDEIVCVCGNCDAEVDAMVLDFPINPGYLELELNGIKTVITHGHRYSADCPPPCDFTLILSGHTHIPTVLNLGAGRAAVNPGSTSIPKGGFSKSFAILDGKSLTVYDFDMNAIFNVVF